MSNGTSLPANCCKWGKCPGTLPSFCIADDGMHPTCRKQKEAEEKRIDTPNGVWKLQNVFQAEAMIRNDARIVKALARQWGMGR